MRNASSKDNDKIASSSTSAVAACWLVPEITSLSFRTTIYHRVWIATTFPLPYHRALVENDAFPSRQVSAQALATINSGIGYLLTNWKLPDCSRAWQT
jgi:hypothetical protein